MFRLIVLQLFFSTGDSSDQGHREWGISPLTFQKGEGVPFHKSILSNFMVYQDRLETNLLQLFAHPENPEW